MDLEARVAQLEAENDDLSEKLGEESIRAKAAREAREAEEARQRELAELEISAMPTYVECLERQGLSREGELLDQLGEMNLRGWQNVVEARADRMAAKMQIEQFVEAFGGNLPPSWEAAKRELLDKQSGRNEVSSGKTWHRAKVAQLVRALVGRRR